MRRLPAAAIAVVLLAILPALASEPGQARTLTFEDRVAAQRAIEEVYWRHRIWPKDNPQPKPPLSAVMPDAAIRAKVEDYLKKSNALQEWWSRPISAAQLQAEMERMAAHTSAPELLRELFASLGDDPDLIAETLARQTLANRLIRGWYARDERFHGDVRRAAERAIANASDFPLATHIGAEYSETTLRLVEGAEQPTRADHAEIDVDRPEWEERIRRLGQAFDLEPRIGSKSESLSRNSASAAEILSLLPPGKLSALHEEDDAFDATILLRKEEATVTIATVSWPKASFDAWWGVQRESTSSAPTWSESHFSVVALSPGDGACTPDDWTPTMGPPGARFGHAVVWTGVEMIVWGGYNPASNQLYMEGARYNPGTETWTPMSAENGARGTPVWTGTEMIVWGLEGGARYDPATDHWVRISDTNSPGPRYAFTEVWTGTEMIVWGGEIDSSYANTGARYDPALDRWVATSAVAGEVPDGRTDHTAVWTGSKMIVWGGTNNQAPPSNSGGEYDPTTDHWTPTASLGAPLGRFGHSAVWTGTEMIVWAGNDSAGYIVNTGSRYDPVTRNWRATAVPVGIESRINHTAVWSGSKMIVWGGLTYDGGTSRHLNTGGRYDPASNTWAATSTQSAPTPREHHRSVWTGTEMIVWGGAINADTALNTGGRYDPSSDLWVTTLANVPPKRSRTTAVWTGAEMLVWGGQFEDGTVTNTGARYVPATDSWIATAIPGAPTARDFHTAVWTGTEMVVWGGWNAVGLASGGRYNTTTDAWVPSSDTNAPAPRWSHTAVWTGTEMIVWGGSPYPYLSTGGRYDPSMNLWVNTPTTSAPAARQLHTAVWTGNEMIVWGGDNSSSPLNTGGRYNPTANAWVATSTSGAPVPRDAHTAVWTGTEMIVWGGWGSGGDLGTGGRYDPSSNHWVATSTVGSPASRRDHTAVWTGNEMIVWGGTGSLAVSFAVNTGGRYEPHGNRWAPTSTVGAPEPRQQHLAVWTGTEMVVWGGKSYYGWFDSGGRNCVCLGARWYRDADGDAYGTLADWVFSCEQPAGYIATFGDCNDTSAAVRPGAAEVCNGIDDNCDGRIDEDALAEDTDGDGVHNACDNCPLISDRGQGDFDHDGEGDVCDLDDGVILIRFNEPNYVEWQEETGFSAWNVYEGDLDVLRGTGVYTQVPGSNPLAERYCGETVPRVADFDTPFTGRTVFSLVTGVASGVEGGLGQDGRGMERPNANPCP